MTFISLKTHIKKPVVCISILERKHNFPLTKEGCIKAGEFLYKNQIKNWLYSSVVDHKDEYEKYIKENPADIIEAAYDAKTEESDAERKKVINKMLDWCDKLEFQSLLNKAEKVLYKSIANESRKRHKQPPT